MANIQELRHQYPQYSDMSDQEFADRFHDKYYSDIPKDDFYKRLGIQQPTTEQSPTDRMKSAVGLNQPSFGQNFAGGMLHGMQSLANDVSNPGFSVLRQMVPQSMQGMVPNNPSQMPSNSFDAYKLMGTSDQPINTLQGLEQTAGEMYMPGKAIEPAISGGVNAIKSGLESLKPSNLFRGNLTPEELQKNLDVTKGTQSSLGDVIGSPFLKRMYENVLSKIPLSGANETMQKTAGQIIDKGHNILNDLLGSNKAEDFEQTLNDSLQDVFSKHHEQKNSLYDKANNIADEIKLKLSLPNFSSSAKKYSDSLQNTNILKHEPEVNYLINKLQNYANPVQETKKIGALVNKQGEPLLSETSIKYPTLKEANLLKGKLNQLADQYSSSPTMTDRHAALTFRNLSKSLKSDITNEISNSGHTGLKSAYESAEKNYAENYSLFLDKEIYKFSSGNADPDMLLSSFIKTGKANDRANLLNKLTEKLPPDKKNLLGYGYLSRALDENNVLNPLKVKTLLSKNSLGKRQFEALFPNEKSRNALRNFVDLADKNTKALKLMQNPDTGQMSMDILPLLSRSKTSLLGKLIGAKPAVNWLTSEKTRENLVNQMIANSKEK